MDAEEITSAALRKVNVIEPGEAAAGGELEAAVAALYRMISSWKAKGVDAALPLAESLEAAVIDLLAMRLATEYGIEPDAGLAASAADGWQSILAAYISAPKADQDLALKRVGAWYGGVIA
jgi:hypothetical protein